MTKHQQEIRDPIHNFVRATADEVLAINSRPFQCLRRIHRLESAIYADFKPAAVGFVFVAPEKRKEAEQWLAANKKQVLSEQMELDL